jgi:carbon monoxide dehydrogenase subunit G
VRYSQSFEIAATPEDIWQVMEDLPAWPEWATSFKRIEITEGEKLALGTQLRMVVRGAPTSEWVVIACEPGSRLTWETDARGVHTVADHVLERTESGTRLTLAVSYSGAMARFWAPLISYVSKRNLALEGNGLKEQAERAAVGAARSAGI